MTLVTTPHNSVAEQRFRWPVPNLNDRSKRGAVSRQGLALQRSRRKILIVRQKIQTNFF